MRGFKKILSLALVAVMFFNMIPIAQATSTDGQIIDFDEYPEPVVESECIPYWEAGEEPVIDEISEESDSGEESIRPANKTTTSMIRYTTISGRIITASGVGIGGTSVYVFNMDDDESVGVYYTDGSGSWESDELEAGLTYIISYYHRNYTFAEDSFTCVATENGAVLETATATQRIAEPATSPEGDFTYSVINGLYISITKYTGSDATVVVPEKIGSYTVQSIGSSVFSGNKTITNIYLPDSIESIGSNAFYNCTNLTNVYLNSGLKSLGSYAFSNCTNLTEIILPNTLTTIGQSAFNGCTGLTVVELPDSVATINQNAFAGCTNLTSINYPRNWSSAGGSIFYNCTKLESITIPEGVTAIPSSAFSGANRLLSVELPESLTSIGSSAFYDCESMTAIELPNGLTSIGSYAFQNCTGLTEVELPDSVATINQSAFNGCSNLININYPRSWSSAGSSIFNGCTNLKSITIPDGVTAIPSNAFSSANGIQKVDFPESLISIGGSAFYGCSQLRYAVLPTSVASIDTYAFANCSALRYVMISSAMCTVGNNAFNNSPRMVLYCKWISDATLYAIKNGVEFQPLPSEEADYSHYVVDMENTSFNTTSAVAQVESFVPLTLHYRIDDSVSNEISNRQIVITFTNNLELIEKSVTLDGTLLTNYTYSNDALTIPVTKSSGTIQVSVTPLKTGTIASYAQFTYSRVGAKRADTIGIVYLDVPILSLNAPSHVSTSSFDISGLTKGGQSVVFYIDGSQAGTAIAKKDGTFSAKLDFPGTPVSGKSYQLTAVLQDGSSASSNATMVYRESAPRLTQFDMYYDAHGAKRIDLLNAEGARLTNSINPGYPFTFNIRFENSGEIGKVFVVSTRNGITNRMEALPTSNAGEYIASGYFEDTAKGYVPGTINLYYTTTTTVEEVTAQLEKEALPVEWQNATTEVIKNTSSEYRAKIRLADGDEVEFETDKNISLADIKSNLLSDESNLQMRSTSVSLQSSGDESWEAVLSFIKDLKDEYKDNVMSNAENLTTSDPKQDVVIVIKDDIGGKIKYIFWESAKDAFRTAGIKFVGTNWIYENSIGVSWADSAAAWGFIADGANIVVHAYNQHVSIDAAEMDIKSSTTLTPAQKEYALKQVEKLRWGYAATNILRIAAAAAGYGFSAAGNPILGTLVKTVLNIAANLADDYLNKALAYYVAGGKGSYLKWLIDPSGYVYDQKTNARLEGVTVTAYCIEFEEELHDETEFWDSPPAKSEYGTVWDASEYSQENPLTTDAEGKYAWDVTEGWWRVKYEKEGYQTTWSEWLPVPPVQDEVNIGMLAIGETADSEFAGTVQCQTSSIPATVSLYDSKNNLIASDTTDASGAYALFASEGAYILVVEKPGYLSYTIKNLVLSDGDIIAEIDISSLGGDVNDDGYVNADDLAQFLSEFGKQPTIYPLADINGDGYVNADDLTCLLAGFGKSDLVVDYAD